MSAGVSMQYRVPYADTDQMAVVYYANYLIYFEMCRAELLRSVGLSYSEIEKEGIALPVLEAHCNYRRSAKFEDLLTITATVEEAKGVRCKIACQVKRGEELLAEGYTIHASISLETGKPVRLPRKLAELAND